MTIDMTPAATAVGTSAYDIGAFIVVHAVLIAAALATVGGVVLAIGEARRKMGLGGRLAGLAWRYRNANPPIDEFGDVDWPNSHKQRHRWAQNVGWWKRWNRMNKTGRSFTWRGKEPMGPFSDGYPW